MSSDFPPLFENNNSFFNNQMLNGNPPNVGSNGMGYNATVNSNDPMDVLSIPESFHLNDEIFFNTSQFDTHIPGEINSISQQSVRPDNHNQNQYYQQQQQQQQNQQSHGYIDSASTIRSFESELVSNMSSNSLNTYFTGQHTASSSSSSSFSSGSTNNQNAVVNSTASKIAATPQPQFTNHGRHGSTSVPIDQLTLLTLRTPTSTKPVNNQLQQNQLNGLQQPNFDNFSPTSTNPLQQQQQQQQVQLPQSSQPPQVPQQQLNQSFQPGLANNVNVDASTVAAAVAAAAATENNADAETIIEEGTINPRQLFNNKLVTSASSPSLSTLFSNGKAPVGVPINPSAAAAGVGTGASAGQQVPIQHEIQQAPPMAQQVDQGLLQNQGTIAPQTAQRVKHMRSSSSPQFDFRMNDDFSNAITTWFTNNAPERLEEEASKLFVNPSGILKNSKSRTHSYSSGVMHSSRGPSRRNSVQLLSNGNAIVTNGLPHSLQNSPVALSSAHFENINEENDNIISNSTPMSTIEDTSINTNNGSEQKKKRRKSSANIASMDGVVPLPDSPSISPTSSNVTKEQVPKKPAATKSERKKSTHSVALTPNAQGAFPCNECDKQFKRSEHLKRHQRSVHSNDRPFPCKYCEKKFSRSDNLAQHLKTHTKLDANGNPTIVYGNPSNHSKRDKKKSS
ncbi:predicted protein [Candida tropicalis MYA-3404]|uniref:C2H2-type domain-containing protein n=1 Tax=Candida tropicalis (strain ATCC MYA-3404 / T1) TaxID=294747 RepID=C5MB11_CANTT|nr:predicted protein [Candida tropicalis MYA-3404]EER32828.1 predicted protein [Candida tropicalis MYA-3404]KAG4406654.1 hypothetical protein JTP64_004038 [Candida tropicalis]